MFDVGFSELVVIGIVALVVIGPERLPKVARMAGHLLGRMQRYVNDVKADINREIQLDELRKLKSDVQDTALNLEASIRGEMRAVETAVGEHVQSARSALDDLAQTSAAGTQAEPNAVTTAPVVEPAVAPEQQPAAKALRPMDQQEDTVLSHLFELRDRLIKALLSIGIVFVCLFPWAKELYALLAQPLIATLPQGGQMIATDVVGVFLVPMNVALMVAFLIALPYVLYQVWAFVAPGLYSHEKRLALPLVAASVVLFFVGMSFAYFLVFPTVFKFMANIAPEGVAWMTDIEKYLSFVMSTFLAFGVTFEVPVVVVVLVRMNIVALETLKEWRSYMIVAAFVIAAIFTPPDVISQLMLAIPLCLLYELGMLMAKFVSKPVKPESDSTDLV